MYFRANPESVSSRLIEKEREREKLTQTFSAISLA